jgi:hypothetical protein
MKTVAEISASRKPKTRRMKFVLSSIFAATLLTLTGCPEEPPQRLMLRDHTDADGLIKALPDALRSDARFTAAIRALRAGYRKISSAWRSRRMRRFKCSSPPARVFPTTTAGPKHSSNNSMHLTSRTCSVRFIR